MKQNTEKHRRRIFRGFAGAGIRTQLIVLYAVCALIIVLGITVSLQYALRLYSTALYQQTDSLLKLVCSNLLDSFQAASDSVRSTSVSKDLQQALSAWENSEDTASRISNASALSDIMYRGVDGNISGLYYITSGGEKFSSGGAILQIEKMSDVLSSIRKTDKEQWTVEENKYFLIVPIHRSEIVGYYSNMGFLAAEINLERLLRNALSSSLLNDSAYSVAIQVDDFCLYPQGGTAVSGDFFENGENMIFRTQTNNGISRYELVQRKKMNGHTWIIRAGVSTDTLAYPIRRAADMAFGLATVIAGIALLLIILYSGKIIQQLRRLSDKMKLFREGSYLPAEEDQLPVKNEISELHRNFDHMAVEYNRMIRENYLKQLLITETSLKALHHQIDPHFMFNTLEIINHYARRGDYENILQTVSSLASLLRASIDQQEMTVTLRDELAFVDEYLQIQCKRFPEMLTCEKNIGEDSLAVYIPKLVIMPLVDNAIRYTLQERDSCRIVIDAYCSDNRITISVTDNGPPLDTDIVEKLRSNEQKSNGNGIGLLNIDSRLRLLYGNEAHLIITNCAEGATVSMTIPAVRCKETPALRNEDNS